MKTPNPGTEEAIKQGCTCPVLDNAHGKGLLWPDKNGNMVVVFWYTSGCPVHSFEEKREKMKQKYIKEPLTVHETDKIDKMVTNGATREGAVKTRLSLRRKKKAKQVFERKRDAIH